MFSDSPSEAKQLREIGHGFRAGNGVAIVNRFVTRLCEISGLEQAKQIDERF